MPNSFLKILLIVCAAFFFTNCNTKTAEEYFRIGAYNDTLGNYKIAVKAYSNAIKKNPNKSIYYLRRANSKSIYYGFIRNSKSILEDYSKAMDLSPWNEEGCYALGLYFYRNGNHKYSLTYLDTLLRKNPKHIEGYLLRGQMYYDKKDTLTGNHNFRKAVENSSDKKETLAQIGSVQKTQGYYYDALVNFNQSLGLSDKVKFNYYQPMSMCYWKIDKKDSACYFYDLITDKSRLLGEYANIKNYCERK